MKRSLGATTGAGASRNLLPTQDKENVTLGSRTYGHEEPSTGLCYLLDRGIDERECPPLHMGPLTPCVCPDRYTNGR